LEKIKKQIINIVIFYDNEKEVYTYAEDLSHQTAKEDIVLVIVVNKKGKTQLENFKSKLNILSIATFVLDPNKNLGYLNGAIYGYEEYCRVYKSMPKWVIVSNTDIEFRNNRFFEDLLYTKYEDDVWCIGPSVYSPKKKSFDNPHYIDRCTKDKINKLIYIHERPILAYVYAKLAIIKGKFFRSKKQENQFIYSVKGCFFIIRNELATILKHRKFKALLYSEESYIAEIIGEYKKRTYYDSTIEVIHNESTITGKLAIKKKSKYIADSLKIIRDEFYR
jgi:GT2 family glycosyltransferase